MLKKDAQNVSDAELAVAVKNGCSEAFAELTERSLSTIRRKVYSLRTSGLDTEDMFQEGLLGLLRAAQTYRPEKGASFQTYADVCISNRIITAYRAANNKKNGPLNDFVSLSGEELPEIEANECESNPETALDSRESFRNMYRKLSEQLSALEKNVLQLYLSGYSYREISQKLSITEKAAANALQRSRNKLKISAAQKNQ